MKIEKDCMVTLNYDLKFDDQNGELIEQATDEHPLKFIFGVGQMFPEFEMQLEGLEEGEAFEIRLDKDDAYGDVNEEAIVDLPRSIFVIDGVFDEEQVSEGNTIPMMTGDGQRMSGIVLEVGEEFVKMDFNHPLAGEDLYFAGKIKNVRKATEEELLALQSGGCGCGCNNGDCDSHDECGSGCNC